MEKGEGRPPKKIKSKKQDFGPLSVDPFPPTIKREILIRDNFLIFFLIGGQYSYKKHAKFTNKVPKEKVNFGANPYPP